MRTHKLTPRLILGSFAIVFGILLTPSFAAAATTPASSGSSSTPPAITCNVTNPDGTVQKNPDGTPVTQDCSQVQDQAATGGSCKNVSSCDLVSRYINPAITFMSVLVGLVVVASIIMGAIQYSSSAGDPQAAAKARGRMQNAIIALVAYIFLVAALNFIVPGGLL